jgi:hypothetical protein
MLVKWVAPLTYEELLTCFTHLSEQISQCKDSVDVVIDITASGHIPVESPILATRSGFLRLPKTRNVFIVGVDSWAQILVRYATRMTGKPITFFATYAEAEHVLRSQKSITDLQEEVHSSPPELHPGQTSHLMPARHD